MHEIKSYQWHTGLSPAPAEIWPPLKQTQGCWERCGDRFLLDGTAAETVQRDRGVKRIDNYQSKQRKPDGLRAQGTDLLTPAEPRSIWGHRDWTNRRRPKSQSTWNNTDHTNYNKIMISLLLLFLGTAACHRKNDVYTLFIIYTEQLYRKDQQFSSSKYKDFLFVEVKSDQVKLSITRNCCTNRKLN